MGRGMAAWARVRKTVNMILPRGRFARSVTLLAGGTALGQAITVLVSPILTRLYTPEDFGVLAVYSSILGIFLVVASWRYELAIPLPEKDEDAINLVVLSLGIVVLMSLLVGLGTWLLGAWVVKWLNAPGLQPCLWLLPIGVFLGGSYQVFNYWAVRKQAFDRIARTKINQGLGAAVMQIVFGFLKISPLGLLIGHVVGQGAGTVTLLSLVQKHDKGIFKAVYTDKMRNVAIRYQRFPKLSIVPAFINSVALQLYVLSLSVLHGPQVTGSFSLVNKVLGMPLTIVSLATAQVLIGHASNYKRLGIPIEPLFWKVIRQQGFLGLPALLLAPICPFAFPTLFGEEWKEAGIYAAVWLPALVMSFISSPTGGFLDVLERQELFLMREISRLFLVGGCVALSVTLELDAFFTILLFSCARIFFACVYAAFSLYAIRHMRRSREDADDTQKK